MICQQCGKAEATIHLTEIINGQMVEMHICEGCAKEKGSDLAPPISFSDLLSGLMEFTAEMGGSVPPEMKCARCNMSWEDFKNTGRLGCAHCYESFEEFLMPLIKKVQGVTHHLGKRPSRLSDKLKIELELKELTEKLKTYIKQEEYEEAAQVRDKIKLLQLRVQKPSVRRKKTGPNDGSV